MQLVAENLVLERGGRTVLAGLSFRLGAGEALLLKGPNGAGKTTLLRALAGFLRPASGTIRIESGGEDREPLELVHVVGHLDGIKAHLTVEENLAFWSAYLGEGGKGREPVAAALERFALAELAGVPAGFLSAGQKRRLALARLGVAQRPIWLLDEPTASLDAAATGLIAEAIEAHVKGGGLAVVATHTPLALAGAREMRLGGAEAEA